MWPSDWKTIGGWSIVMVTQASKGKKNWKSTEIRTMEALRYIKGKYATIIYGGNIL